MRDSGDSDQHNMQTEGASDVEISDLDQESSASSRHRGFTRRVNRAFERSFGPGKPARRRVGIVTVVVLVVLAFVLSYEGGLFRVIGMYPRGSAAQPSRHVIMPELLGLSNPFACLLDAVWSPDGRYVAVLGYRNDCAFSVLQPGLIAIYDARTGKVVGQIEPDRAILQALHKRSTANMSLFYNSLLWSPDGTRLAILFGVASPEAPLDGVMLIGKNGAGAEVIVHRVSFSAATYEYLVWDLVQKRPEHVIDTASNAFLYPINYPVAESYRWGAGGSLIPETQAHSSSSLTGPVGNPDGGSSFTIWQEGGISLTYQNGSSQEYLPGVYTWDTYFVAWSNDGRYIADGLELSGRLAAPDLPQMSKLALQALQVNNLPVLPVRDKGMAQALQELKVPTITSPGTVSDEVAWRPDGRELAVNDDSGDISIYDCASGRLLATLPVPAGLASTLHLKGGRDSMRWSPDGSRLLLSGPTVGVGDIWGPGQLPAG